MFSNFIADLPAWGVVLVLVLNLATFTAGCNLYKKSHLGGMGLILISAIGGYAYVNASIPADNPSNWMVIVVPILIILGGFAFGTHFEEMSKAKRQEQNDTRLPQG